MSDNGSHYQTNGQSGLSSINYVGEHYFNTVDSVPNLLLGDQNSFPSILSPLSNEKDFGLSLSNFDAGNDVSLSDDQFDLSADIFENQSQPDISDKVAVQQSNITTSVCTDTVKPLPQTMYNQRSMSTNIFSWLDKTETWNIERQRKHSHNLVERRRRYKINDKIKELETLLPGRNRYDSVPQNKNSILTATVDYIKQFQGDQERICLLEERQRRMEQHVKKIIKVLQRMQSRLASEQMVEHVGKCTEERLSSKFNIKGYIPIYQAQRDKDNDDNIEEIYSSFEELNVDQENNIL